MALKATNKLPGLSNLDRETLHAVLLPVELYLKPLWENFFSSREIRVLRKSPSRSPRRSRSRLQL